jgi:hypothetical protein
VKSDDIHTKVWSLRRKRDWIILEEIRSIRNTSASSSVMFGYDELKEMHYLYAAITEL